MESADVRLVSITPGAEQVMAYCARVSNPANQENPDSARLLAYCARHGHWSVFEQANMILEIRTSRAISAQILRHRSFSFQEFSQRYSLAEAFIPMRARRQDAKNRQSSIDDVDPEGQDWFLAAQREVWEIAHRRYVEALEKGIAKECARNLLPLGTATRLYMNGTIRSWIHYISVRSDASTQLEHRRIAEKCRAIFRRQMPGVATALGWGA